MSARKAGNGKLARYTRDAWLEPDQVSGVEMLKIAALELWAMTGKRPPGHEAWLLDPQAVEIQLKRLGIWSVGVQTRILQRAMAPQASIRELELADGVARNALDRLLGKPAEKVAVAGHVVVEFAGLDPDALPGEAPKDQTEVVDLPPPGDQEA